jgi:ATP-dependent protease ClpP protease subunit
MSLIKLPTINAKGDLAKMNWSLREDAVANWAPEIVAAAEDETTITIYDVIGEDWWTGEGVTSKRIAAALRKIGERDVTVNINSAGGNFFEGIAIYNHLKEHPAKVTVRVMGLAASAASVIAMAGDEILVAETGFLMIHNAWTIVVGNRHDIAGEVETLASFDNSMAELYAKRSGENVEAAASWMDKETWFSGKDAVENGLATGLLGQEEIDEDPRAKETASQVRSAILVDNSLRQTNPTMSRSERRALLSDFKGGTSSATPEPAKPSAGEFSSAVDALVSSINA